jgi:hypothetical protein
MIGYKIMLVMLIFSGVCGGLNSLGWYNQKLPDQKVVLNQAQVTEFSQGVGKMSINPWTGYTMLQTFYNVGGSALLALLSIIPFLTAFGVDFQIALMIQTPIWLVLIWTVYEIWTGHTTTMQE